MLLAEAVISHNLECAKAHVTELAVVGLSRWGGADHGGNEDRHEDQEVQSVHEVHVGHEVVRMSPWPTLHTQCCPAPPVSQEHPALLLAPGGGMDGEGARTEGEGARSEGEAARA